MGKSTISMAIFNSYVKLPEGRSQISHRYVIGMVSECVMSYVWTHSFCCCGNLDFRPEKIGLKNHFRNTGQRWGMNKNEGCNE